jgi:hypothetical protein
MAPDRATEAQADPPTRLAHDPTRAAVSSVQAGKRLGCGKDTVVRRIKTRALDGYGIRGSDRTRWYVFEEELPPGPASGQSNVDYRAEAAAYRSALVMVIASNDLRDEAAQERRMAARYARRSAAAMSRADGLTSKALAMQSEALQQLSLPLHPNDPTG